jgi:hypothetical protein
MERPVRGARIEPEIIAAWLERAFLVPKTAIISGLPDGIDPPQPAAGNGIFRCRDRTPKLGRKTAAVTRDRKGIMKWPEIPTETACFTPVWESVVWHDWMVGATGIEPVTPSMSTRCLKPNMLIYWILRKRLSQFFAVCSRRIVAVNGFCSYSPQETI